MSQEFTSVCRFFSFLLFCAVSISYGNFVTVSVVPIIFFHQNANTGVREHLTTEVTTLHTTRFVSTAAGNGSTLSALKHEIKTEHIDSEEAEDGRGSAQQQCTMQVLLQLPTGETGMYLCFTRETGVHVCYTGVTGVYLCYTGETGVCVCVIQEKCVLYRRTGVYVCYTGGIGETGETCVLYRWYRRNRRNMCVIQVVQEKQVCMCFIQMVQEKQVCMCVIQVVQEKQATGVYLCFTGETGVYVCYTWETGDTGETGVYVCVIQEKCVCMCVVQENRCVCVLYRWYRRNRRNMCVIQVVQEKQVCMCFIQMVQEKQVCMCVIQVVQEKQATGVYLCFTGETGVYVCYTWETGDTGETGVYVC